MPTDSSLAEVKSHKCGIGIMEHQQCCYLYEKRNEYKNEGEESRNQNESNVGEAQFYELEGQEV
ncbi:hypothetical protein ACE6H2_027723 [Prunus campanulata]